MEEFFILSTERTGTAPWGNVCVWWCPDANGYTAVIAEAGRYTRAQAIAHADPPRHVAIPCHVVDVPASRATSFRKHGLKEGRFDVAAHLATDLALQGKVGR